MLFCIYYGSTKAQFFNYVSTSASSEDAFYVDLAQKGTKVTTNYTGGVLNAATATSQNSTVQNIGFTFSFAGVSYTQFTLNTNGFIKLGNDTVTRTESTDVLFSTDPSATNVIYAFNGNLQPTSSSEYRVYTDGAAGSRTCTIQFKAVADSGCPDCSPSSSPQYDNVEFQIILFETSNNIDFIYGGFTANLNPAGFVPYNCGLKSNSKANSVNATKSSQTQYTNVAFVDGAYTGNRFNTRNNLLPSLGFTIHWVPILIKNNNVKLLNEYIIGKVPKQYDHEMKVNVRNIGATSLTNFPITVTVSGANSQVYNQTIASLASGAKATITIPAISWQNAGKNTIAVSIPNDDDNSDNLDTVYQTVTPLTIGYCTDSIFGGRVGNTTNSIDLGTRFHIPGASNKITSVTAYIDTPGRLYRIYVYGVNADTPKVKLSNMATNLTSVAGKNVYTFATPLTVPSDFVVVVTQLSVNTSVRLGYQYEDPIRDKTFYFRIPQGSSVGASSSWSDFAPGNPFKLMVDVTMLNAFLPVKLVSFTAHKDGRNNVLNWQTASEINNLGFEIQRSADGTDFTKIDFVNAKGDNKTIANYMFYDVHPLTGNNYYRLRQLDKDGNESLSEIVQIKNAIVEKSEIASVYPNPTSDNVSVVLTSIQKEKYTIKVTDIYGRTLKQDSYQAQQGSNKININSSSFAAGTYFVKILSESNETIATTKFVKQ